MVGKDHMVLLCFISSSNLHSNHIKLHTIIILILQIRKLSYRGGCFNITLFMYLYLAVLVFVSVLALSSCREQGLFCSCGVRASHYDGLSCGARALGCTGQLLWHMGFVACVMWALPGPVIESVSPALTGGLSTTESPGKPTEKFCKWLKVTVGKQAGSPIFESRQFGSRVHTQLFQTME